MASTARRVSVHPLMSDSPPILILDEGYREWWSSAQHDSSSLDRDGYWWGFDLGHGVAMAVDVPVMPLNGRAMRAAVSPRGTVGGQVESAAWRGKR